MTPPQWWWSFLRTETVQGNSPSYVSFPPTTLDVLCTTCCLPQFFIDSAEGGRREAKARMRMSFRQQQKVVTTGKNVLMVFHDHFIRWKSSSPVFEMAPRGDEGENRRQGSEEKLNLSMMIAKLTWCKRNLEWNWDVDEWILMVTAKREERNLNFLSTTSCDEKGDDNWNEVWKTIVSFLFPPIYFHHFISLPLSLLSSSSLSQKTSARCNVDVPRPTDLLLFSSIAVDSGIHIRMESSEESSLLLTFSRNWREWFV